MNLLKEGDIAPSFSFHNADGTSHSTDDLKGTTFVVYFYPRDDTPGCTKEACGFRDQWEKFQEAEVTVIGVSADSEESHNKFRNKYDLPFALAADEDKAIVQAYGTWGEKSMMGRTYQGIHRVTYLVDTDGRIAKVYPKVKPNEHAEQILQDLDRIYSKAPRE